MRRISLIFALILGVVGFRASAVAQDGSEIRHCLASDQNIGALVSELMAPLEIDQVVEDGWTWSGLAPEETGARIIIVHAGEMSEARLEHVDSGGEPISSSFSVRFTGAETGRPILESMLERLRANDTGAIDWTECSARESERIEAGRVSQERRGTIPPGHEDYFRELILPIDPAWEASGYRFTSVRIMATSVVYELSQNRNGIGEIQLQPLEEALEGEVVAGQFVVRPLLEVTDPILDEIVRVVTSNIVANSTELVVRNPGATVRQRMLNQPGGLNWLALLLVPLLVPRRRQTLSRPPFRITHLLPAALQIVILAYWAIYIEDVRDFMPYVALQLAFAFAFDVLLARRRYGTWSASASILPLVFSTSLFVHFTGLSFGTQQLIIATAILSKEFVRYKGRHLLNPSAFGIALIGAISLFVPALGYGDIAAQFGAPPNMTEVLILLSLVVQLKLPVVLITATSWLGLELWSMHGLGFAPMWAPVYLVLALLITDPATSSRTPWGRLLYGFTLGVTIGACGELLTHAGYSDFYGKVIPVPLVNALAPFFDKVGTKIHALNAKWRGTQVLNELLSPRWNKLHVLGWLVLASAIYAKNKESMFMAHIYNDQGSPVVQFNPDGPPVCADNPVFCEPYSFVGEARLWWDVAKNGPLSERED